MIREARKWIAIRRYVKGLGPDLRKRYGRSKRYTPAQVKRTVQDRHYNADWLCFALCIYCSRRDFDEYHRAIGESCDYDAMRTEVGARFFGGSTTFDATDATDSSAPSSAEGGAGGDSGADGSSD